MPSFASEKPTPNGTNKWPGVTFGYRRSCTTFFVWHYGLLAHTWQFPGLRDLVKQGDLLPCAPGEPDFTFSLENSSDTLFQINLHHIHVDHSSLWKSWQPTILKRSSKRSKSICALEAMVCTFSLFIPVIHSFSNSGSLLWVLCSLASSAWYVEMLCVRNTVHNPLRWAYSQNYFCLSHNNVFFRQATSPDALCWCGCAFSDHQDPIVPPAPPSNLPRKGPCRATQCPLFIAPVRTRWRTYNPK